MKLILIITIFLSLFIFFNNIICHKFLSIILTSLFTYYFIINRKKLILNSINFYFKRSNMIDLSKYNSFNEFINKHFNSKRKNDIKKELIKMESVTVKKSKLHLYHIIYLYEFLYSKIDNKFTRFLEFFLSIACISTFELNYLNYYDSNNNLLGWSSYFIDDNKYYDFLSSPNKSYISHICLNSIKYCFSNNIKYIDLGPTHDDIKKRKFNSKQYLINVKLSDIF